MKIVILVSYTYPYIGSGIGQVALMQAEELAKQGHEVVLVSSNVPQTESRFTKNGVLHLKLRSLNFLDRFAIPVPLFLLNREVVAHIRSADIVHTHDLLYPHSLQAGFLAKIYHKPFILTQHAGFIVYPSKFVNLLQWLTRQTLGNLVLRLSDKVLLINDEIKRWLGIDKNKAITLINGISNTLFHRVDPKTKTRLQKKYGLPYDKKIVLYVGRLVEKKGFRRLFDIRSNDYFIVMVGGGLVPPEMYSAPNQIRFLGQLNQNQLSEIYQASDIFALPSDCEGFPLSIQEAMACGLPIITSRHPGFDRYLDERFVKFISLDNGELKTAILRLIADEKLYRQMSEYSYKNRQIRPSWKNNTKNLVEIYHQALSYA